MSIEIKSRYGGRVLYTAENAQDIREAVVEATRRGADLGGAYLRGAYLRGADLGGAYLRGADLGGAYLRDADLGGADLGGADLGGAYLRGADLGGAYLRGADLGDAYLRDADLGGAYLRDADLGGAYLRDADLGGAYLRDADLGDADLGDADLGGAYLRDADLGDADLGDRAFDRRHPLWSVRLDLWSVLDAAPAEVATLREKVVAGEVNGSVYEGECACLVGTIANARGVSHRELEDLKPDVDRPAEKWFLSINKGDLPVLVAGTGDVEQATKTARENRDAITEGAWRATWVLRWIDQWTESRTSTAAALIVASPDLVLRNLNRDQLETLAAASETHVDTINAEERTGGQA